jgi:hypothetical protein
VVGEPRASLSCIRQAVSESVWRRQYAFILVFTAFNDTGHACLLYLNLQHRIQTMFDPAYTVYYDARNHWNHWEHNVVFQIYRCLVK